MQPIVRRLLLTLTTVTVRLHVATVAGTVTQVGFQRGWHGRDVVMAPGATYAAGPNATGPSKSVPSLGQCLLFAESQGRLVARYTPAESGDLVRSRGGGGVCELFPNAAAGRVDLSPMTFVSRAEQDVAGQPVVFVRLGAPALEWRLLADPPTLDEYSVSCLGSRPSPSPSSSVVSLFVGGKTNTTAVPQTFSEYKCRDLEAGPAAIAVDELDYFTVHVENPDSCGSDYVATGFEDRYALNVPHQIVCHKLLPPAWVDLSDCYTFDLIQVDEAGSLAAADEWQSQCGNSTHLYAMNKMSFLANTGDGFVDVQCCRLRSG